MATTLEHSVAAAARAQWALESRIEGIDRGWDDETRRAFEARHLKAIRADARHLHTELEEIAATVERAVRVLRRETHR